LLSLISLFNVDVFSGCFVFQHYLLRITTEGIRAYIRSAVTKTHNKTQYSTPFLFVGNTL